MWDNFNKLADEADVDMTPRAERSSLALLKACMTGDRSAAMAALKRGAEFGWKDPAAENMEAGMTALHWAAGMGHVELLGDLIKAGAESSSRYS
ncbi:hypothetical protein T484DRAFT_1760832 [Baffinella frigidus]|nr:hypothetical protein T484DRAFT_1760832 [Cryptophyta sp. CCMP2293]